MENLNSLLELKPGSRVVQREEPYTWNLTPSHPHSYVTLGKSPGCQDYIPLSLGDSNTGPLQFVFFRECPGML